MPDNTCCTMKYTPTLALYVGQADGDSEGNNVGAVIGTNDGVCDGNAVLGLVLGTNDGVCDGTVLGLVLGTDDGVLTLLGLTLGTDDGVHDGIVLGICVVLSNKMNEKQMYNKSKVRTWELQLISSPCGYVDYQYQRCTRCLYSTREY